MMLLLQNEGDVMMSSEIAHKKISLMTQDPMTRSLYSYDD